MRIFLIPFLGVHYYIYSIMGPQPLLKSLRPLYSPKGSVHACHILGAQSYDLAVCGPLQGRYVGSILQH